MLPFLYEDLNFNFGMQYIPTRAIHLINYNKKAKLIPTLQLVCCPKKDSISCHEAFIFEVCFCEVVL